MHHKFENWQLLEIYKIPIICINIYREIRPCTSFVLCDTDELSTVTPDVYRQGEIFPGVKQSWETSKGRQATFPSRDKAKPNVKSAGNNVAYVSRRLKR